MTLLNILQQADLSILFLINHQLANPVFDVIFKFTHYFTYLFLGVLVLYFVLKKKNSIVLLLIIALIVNFLAASIMKTAVGRERPYQILDVRHLVEDGDNTSFPSRHVQLSFAAATIVFSFYRRFGSLLFLLSLLIGIGRIYVGAHYPSDIMGGALIGVLSAILIMKIVVSKKSSLTRSFASQFIHLKNFLKYRKN